MMEQLKEAITQETADILIQGKHTIRPTSGSDSQLVVAHPMCSVVSRGQVGGAGRKTVLILNKLLIS